MPPSPAGGQTFDKPPRGKTLYIKNQLQQPWLSFCSVYITIINKDVN